MIFEQRLIIVCFYILYLVGDKNKLFVCRLYFFVFIFNILIIYGQIIGNLFELRLFLYLMFLVVVNSPFRTNMATCGVLIVEQVINIFDIQAYLYSNIY